jgi:hypothetical protein
MYFAFLKFQAVPLAGGRRNTRFLIRPTSSQARPLETLSQVVHLYTEDDRPIGTP